MPDKIKRGFTLIEILLVIAITGVIVAVSISPLNNLIKAQALDKDYISVAALVDQAKSLSINSKAGSQYGVRFTGSTAVLFKGINYTPGDPNNQIYDLNSRVNISEIDFDGGAADEIVFSRLTGYANASGTVTVSLKSDPGSFKTIKIYQTGTVEYE